MAISRRAILGAAALGSVTGLVSSCSPPSAPEGGTRSPGADGSVPLPVTVPYEGVVPDAPATPEGAAPYFRQFPDEPVAFVSDKPMAGGTVTALTFMNSLPAPVDENVWWQAINDALGGAIEMDGAAVGDYPAKLQTVVASNDIPDLMAILPGTVPAIGELLAAKFADLSDHLAGDAVATYPGLANIPSDTWRGCMVDGRLYAVPIPRFSLDRCYLTRADLADKAGVTAQPSNGEELLEVLRGLTDKKAKTFGAAHIWGLLQLFREMHGAPNDWAVVDGSLVKDYETEEFKAALEVARQVWSEGLVHPNAFDANISLQIQGYYNAGIIGFFPGVASWDSNAESPLLEDPAAVSVPMEVNTWDGSGPAVRYLNGGAPYLTAIGNSDPARVEELLRVVNWFASPFGTKEYVLTKFGVEGVDHTVDDGVYTLTDQGKADYPSGLNYTGAPAMVHYSPTNPDIAEQEYDSEVLGMQTGIVSPSLGLASSTDESKGAALDRQMTDVQADIIQGRKPLSAWDDAVADWRTKGGDTIREEFGAALAAAG